MLEVNASQKDKDYILLLTGKIEEFVAQNKGTMMESENMHIINGAIKETHSATSEILTLQEL
ncbi:MAG: hypothetical protein IPP52_09385 [Ignavibacteria bacterium]|nr:hypothetical protein [Ignavibacteria bacterium]